MQNQVMIDEHDISLYEDYFNNWNKFARDVLGVRLDRRQRGILNDIQTNIRVSVRSGHACGKDFVAAVAALCYLYLNIPSKVILTAPTNRQVIDIMMTEVRQLHSKAKINLGGKVLVSKILFEDPEWYLEGFKAQDKAIEDWSGFHSQNLMLIVTEATGIDKVTFGAMSGILTGGNSRFVLIFNPNRSTGEAYKSSKSPRYKKVKMSALNAVNVRAKKILIKGQVDWGWVDDMVNTPSWTTKIEESDVDKSKFDFKWNGEWYRPSDLFLINVLGEFGMSSEDTLIPASWVELANERWKKLHGKGEGTLRLGVDVAGMGVDLGVHAFRRGNVVEKFKTYGAQDLMVTVGKIKNELIDDADEAEVDAIGEGAGVYSRLWEQGVNVQSVKGSRSAKGLSDLTGMRYFINMRAYLYWAIRDALDPGQDGNLALPPIDELTQDLTSIHFIVKSNGKIIMEPKDNIKKFIGRSPDYGDALACTFLPFSGDGFRYITLDDERKKPKAEDKDDDDDKNEDKDKNEDIKYRGIDEDDDDDNDNRRGLDRRERLFRRLEEDEDD